MCDCLYIKSCTHKLKLHQTDFPSVISDQISWEIGIGGVIFNVSGWEDILKMEISISK